LKNAIRKVREGKHLRAEIARRAAEEEWWTAMHYYAKSWY